MHRPRFARPGIWPFWDIIFELALPRTAFGSNLLFGRANLHVQHERRVFIRVLRVLRGHTRTFFSHESHQSHECLSRLMLVFFEVPKPNEAAPVNAPVAS